jgi:hypothetical protein
MRHDKYFEAKKEFNALMNRLHANYEAQRNLGWIELDEPRFAGYKKFLVLRPDIANRSDAHVFQELINRFGTTEYCRNRSFRYHYHRGKYEEKVAKIGDISPAVYESLSPAIKKWFSVETFRRYPHQYYPIHYCIVPDFYFEQKVKKHYITKVRIHDSSLEAEEAEIKFFLKKNKKFNKFDGHWYGDKGTAPHWFRREMNRKEKFRAKRELRDTLTKDEDFNYRENYRGAYFIYW